MRIWRSKTKECYCAFCRTPRKVYVKRHIGIADAFYGLLISVLLMFSLWQNFHPKFFLMFPVVVLVQEVFILLRWRLGISCPHCGFDPVLYMRSHSAASEKVKKHLDRRSRDPLVMLSSQPKLDLPYRIEEKDRPFVKPDGKGQTRGRLVSKQV